MHQKKLLSIVIFLISISLFINCDEIPKDNSKPNIILILADDLGYGDLSCYGQKNFSTPNIDKLAKEGIRFTQHYSGSTVCAPSRCVLMTGKHTGNAYVRGNYQNPKGYGQLPIPSSEETFVKYLKNCGYKTGMFGKWGLGNAGSAGDPLKHGFDYFFGYHDQVLAHNSFPEYLIKNNEKVYLKNKVDYQSDTLWHKGLGSVSSEKIEYSNDLIFQDMLKYIENNKDEKFFAYFPTTIPHDNGEAKVGERFEVPYRSKYEDKNWENEDKNYARLVEHLDSYIGKLEKKLKELKITDNTIIIFTSDNGPLASLNLNSAGDLRGNKRDLYEGGIRVPLIIKWPAIIEKSIISNHISAFWDFFPTLCEVAGISDYPILDGISFLPTLQGKNQRKHEYLYWEFHWWGKPIQAIRTGEFKGIRNSATDNIELYNLEKDIFERNDISKQNLDKVLEIKQIMDRARSESQYFKL